MALSVPVTTQCGLLTEAISLVTSIVTGGFLTNAFETDMTKTYKTPTIAVRATSMPAYYFATNIQTMWRILAAASVLGTTAFVVKKLKTPNLKLQARRTFETKHKTKYNLKNKKHNEWLEAIYQELLDKKKNDAVEAENAKEKAQSEQATENADYKPRRRLKIAHT
jgi:hypothetical protein